LIYYDKNAGLTLLSKLLVSEREAKSYLNGIMKVATKMYGAGATVFISNEGFFGKFATGYSECDDIAYRLSCITKDIDTSIIAFVRRQDTFMESCYSQAVSKQQLTLSFNEFIETVSEKYIWQQILSGYVRHFTKNGVSIYPYEDILTDKDRFVGNLFSFCDNNINIDISNIIERNAGITASGIYKIAEANKNLRGHKLTDYRRRIHIGHKKPACDPYNLYTSGEDRTRVVEFYDKYNDTLFADFIKGYGNIYHSVAP